MQQYNPAASHAPAPPAAAQGKQPGMLAQMAATAGSVAVGSTIGHGLSSMLFGGGQAAPPVEQQAPPQQQQQQSYQQGVSCEVQAKGMYIFYSIIYSGEATLTCFFQTLQSVSRRLICNHVLGTLSS